MVVPVGTKPTPELRVISRRFEMAKKKATRKKAAKKATRKKAAKKPDQK